MPKTLAVLLQPDLPVALQLRWSLRLATARRLDLLILHRVESRDAHVTEVDLNEPPAGQATGVIHEIQQVLAESPAVRLGPREGTDIGGVAAGQEGIHVRLKLIFFDDLASLRGALLDALNREAVTLFTQARAQITDQSDVDLIRERRLFLR